MMDVKSQRVKPIETQIVAEARTWLGTRFQHQGRLKRSLNHAGACDCLGLLVGVSKGLGLGLERFDRLDYGHYPEGDVIQSVLDSQLKRISKSYVRYGCVLLLSSDHAPRHLAIVSDYPHNMLGMIHAYAPSRKVVEHRLDAHWRDRIVAVYTVPTTINTSA